MVQLLVSGNVMMAGRYLIVQMDNGNDPLNLKEVTAYGAMTFE